MVILVCGNVIDGVSFIGPFDDREHAIRFANHDPYLDGTDWYIGEVHQPTEPEIDDA